MEIRLYIINVGKKFPYIFFKFQDGPDAGKYRQVLVHTLSIGDKTYTVKKINLEGSDPCNEETEEEVAENNFTGDEVRSFQEDWNKNWNPSLVQPKEGGIKGVFQKMDADCGRPKVKKISYLTFRSEFGLSVSLN